MRNGTTLQIRLSNAHFMCVRADDENCILLQNVHTPFRCASFHLKALFWFSSLVKHIFSHRSALNNCHSHTLYCIISPATNTHPSPPLFIFHSSCVYKNHFNFFFVSDIDFVLSLSISNYTPPPIIVSIMFDEVFVFIFKFSQHKHIANSFVSNFRLLKK